MNLAECIDNLGRHIKWVGRFDLTTIFNFGLFATNAIIFTFILKIGIYHVIWSTVLLRSGEAECRALGRLLGMFL